MMVNQGKDSRQSSPFRPFIPNQPFLSFLILTFNSEKYLKQCVDSVLSQDLQSYEIIVIDGGSKDSTLVLLDNYSKIIARFHYYVYPGTSIGRARAHGMTHVQGNLIVFLDSDCVLPMSNWISDMIAGIDSKKIAGVFTFGKYNPRDPSILRYSILSNPYRKAVQDPLIGSHNYIPHRHWPYYHQEAIN